MTYLHVLILSFVEGLTEFLPVSSTGHLILTAHYLGIESSDFLKGFEVIIQFGAIMAVVALYFKRFVQIDIQFYKKLFVGVLPALALGFLLKDKIDQLLDSTATVAWSLIIGGVIFLIADIVVKPNVNKLEMSLPDSFKIGLLQCFALIPGVSRSGATILGAQLLKYPKQLAAEYSFFLAVPTLTAATLYKCWKIRNSINADQIPQLGLGIILSFIFALFAIRFFIALVGRFGFKWFGLYRIILGIVVLIKL